MSVLGSRLLKKWPRKARPGSGVLPKARVFDFFRRKPKVFIHIGTVKTGSTYLQKTFYQNAKLFERYGLTYPFIFPPPLHLPRYVNAEFLYNSDRDIEADVIVRNSRLPKILISEEGLFFDLKRTKHPAISDLQTTLILYVRRPSELILSWAAESAEPYNAFLPELGTHSGPMVVDEAINYLTRGYRAAIQRFQAFVDENPGIRIVVRPFSKSSLRNGDLLTDFLDCVRIDANRVRRDPDFQDIGKINEGRDRKFCDISCLVWELLGKPRVLDTYNHSLIEQIYARCLSGDTRQIIETVDDAVIASITDRLSFFDDYLSRKFCNGKPFFANRTAGAETRSREPYRPLDRSEVEALLNDVLKSSDSLREPCL